MDKAGIGRIAGLALVCADCDVAERFFVAAFAAERVGHTVLDESWSVLLGVPGTRIEERIVRIGRQTIALMTFDPPGRPYPPGSTSTDLWFQHFAIIVSDIDVAYDRLREVGAFSPISEAGPVTLPPASGSVRAFKFRDAEGHPLEFLAFPAGQGPAVWRDARESGLFLGIDHSAISVGSTKASRAFYEGVLGLCLGDQTDNRGPEQSRMDAVPDARVTVTGLQPEHVPPHVELLGYEVGSRRPIDPATTSADIAATQYRMESGDLDALVEVMVAHDVRFVSPGVVSLPDGRRAVMVLDPDGHRLVVQGP